MFEAIYDNRSNQELLSYWIDLEREANADIEKDYETVWEEWKPDEESEETGILAHKLWDFLTDAGGYYHFTEILARLALVISEKAREPEYQVIIDRLNSLGLQLLTNGNYEAAEPLLRRALAIAEKVRGYRHQVTGAQLMSLGRLHRSRGEYEAAEPLLRRALAIAETTQGLGHQVTGRALDYLAMLNKDQGDARLRSHCYVGH